MKYRYPAIIWAVVIFILSSVPSSAIPKMDILSHDKLIHGTIFFIFGVFVYRALAPGNASHRFNWKRALVSFAIVAGYGILDELHQHFVPGRTPDIYDALADALGGLISLMAMFGYVRIRFPDLKKKLQT
ncbi:MAG: VanZ family protein [Bacteroidota bacterium]|jgi:VanZ family protein